MIPEAQWLKIRKSVSSVVMLTAQLPGNSALDLNQKAEKQLPGNSAPHCLLLDLG